MKGMNDKNGNYAVQEVGNDGMHTEDGKLGEDDFGNVGVG
jgi:hypothetical protein